MQMGGAPNSDPDKIDFVLDAVYSSLFGCLLMDMKGADVDCG